MRKHAFKYVRPEFADNVEVGDVIVGGENFGCGSSREHAALVFKEIGVHLVAKSYGWIFKRNCVNLGVLPLEIELELEIENELAVRDGNEVEIDIGNLVLRDITSKKSYQIKEVPNFILGIYRAGGLIEYLNHSGFKV